MSWEETELLWDAIDAGPEDFTRVGMLADHLEETSDYDAPGVRAIWESRRQVEKTPSGLYTLAPFIVGSPSGCYRMASRANRKPDQYDRVAFAWARGGYQRYTRLRVFCEGETIYSYGRHFPIARWVGGVVLVNSGRYSSTTARHQRWVWGLIRGMPQFHVEDFDRLASNLAAYDRRIAAIEAKIPRARANKAGYESSLASEIDARGRFETWLTQNLRSL